MTKLLPTLFTTALLALPAHAEIVEEDVPYELPGGETATGLLVFDDAQVAADDTAPGVLVIPEWWGWTPFPAAQAERIAANGRVAFVADMYGDRQRTDDTQKAKELSRRRERDRPRRAGDRRAGGLRRHRPGRSLQHCRRRLLLRRQHRGRTS